MVVEVDECGGGAEVAFQHAVELSFRRKLEHHRPKRLGRLQQVIALRVSRTAIGWQLG